MPIVSNIWPLIKRIRLRKGLETVTNAGEFCFLSWLHWEGSSLEFYYDAVAESIRAEHPGLGLNALCCIHDCLRCPTTCYYLHRGCRLNES